MMVWTFIQFLRKFELIVINRVFDVNPIKDFSINRSYNLGLFLNVNKCFDDREATLVWTQHYLDQHIDDDYEDVKRAFLAFFPDGAFMQF